MKLLKKFFLFILVFSFVLVPSKESQSFLPVAIVGCASNPACASAVVGGGLILSGALLSPQQRSDYYGAVDQAINSFGTDGGNLARNAWQVMQATNSLGLSYMGGRAAALAMSANDFYNTAQGMLGSLSQSMRDFLGLVDPSSTSSPQVGDIMTNESGDNFLVTSVTSSRDCQWLNTSGTIWSATSVGIRTNGPDYTGCVGDPPHAIYLDYCVIVPTTEPATWNPSIPDYSPIVDGFPGIFNPSSPTYNPEAQKDFDEIIKNAPPGQVRPVDRSDPDGPAIPDISDGEIATVPPEPVPIDAPVDPAPLIDNELLQGIYNNTLATAKNTHKIDGKVDALKDAVVALPAQITTPIVAAIAPIVPAIQALPGQIVPPITTAIGTQTGQIVGKLDEIKNAIPPPIEEIIADDQGVTFNPPDNVYDTLIPSPDELSLSDSINTFIQSGLPFFNWVDGSGIAVDSSQSYLSATIWGEEIIFDLAPYENIIRAMGTFLYGICVISSLFIIARRS